MQTRKFDELISYFNRKVAEMSIDIKYKMELLGMVTALGLAHEKELTAQPQRTEALKAEIRRMKRSFTTCINSDYYTGYMSALSALEGYIAKMEGDAE